MGQAENNKEQARRSLENYIAQHPKAKGARTLTEARKLVFGEKRSQHGLMGKNVDLSK